MQQRKELAPSNTYLPTQFNTFTPTATLRPVRTASVSVHKRQFPVLFFVIPRARWSGFLRCRFEGTPLRPSATTWSSSHPLRFQGRRLISLLLSRFPSHPPFFRRLGVVRPKATQPTIAPLPFFVSFGDLWRAPGSRSILPFRVQDAPPTLTGPTRVARLLSCRSEARRNGTCLVQARLLATVAMDTHHPSLPILPICLDRGAPVGNRDPLGIEPGTQPDTNGVGKGKGGRREDRGVQVPAGSIPRERISPIARTENDAAISTSGDTAGRGSCEVPP